MLVSDEFLRSIGASYFHTDRGGDITYHGYGQLVGYPILDLERLGLSLKEYVWTVEECVIRTVAEYGIEAGRLDGATGVWIEGDTPRARKICAIGVKASRYVTMHGFALNVTTDLRYFSYINPCGFVDKAPGRAHGPSANADARSSGPDAPWHRRACRLPGELLARPEPDMRPDDLENKTLK